MYQIHLCIEDKIIQNIQQHIHKITSPMHLTLATLQDINDAFIAELDALFLDMNSIELQLISYGCMEHVLYVLPLYDDVLHRLSTNVYTLVKKYNLETKRYRYAPFHQLLHITLARKLDEAQLKRGLSILVDQFEVHTLCVDTVALCNAKNKEIVRGWKLKKNA